MGCRGAGGHKPPSNLNPLAPGRYEQEFAAAVAAAAPADSPEAAWGAEHDVVVRYDSQRSYERIALKLKMMRDWKVRARLGAVRACAWGFVVLRCDSQRGYERIALMLKMMRDRKVHRAG